MKTRLADGPVPAAELNQAAAEAELSRDVLAKAKKELDVDTRRVDGVIMTGYRADLP